MAQDFEALRKALQDLNAQTTLLKEWYEKDNNDDGGQYFLKPATHLTAGTWLRTRPLSLNVNKNFRAHTGNKLTIKSGILWSDTSNPEVNWNLVIDSDQPCTITGQSHPDIISLFFSSSADGEWESVKAELFSLLRKAMERCIRVNSVSGDFIKRLNSSGN